MRILGLVVMPALLLAFSAQRRATPPASITLDPGIATAAETQPTTKPSAPAKKAPSVDDEIKTLALKSMNVNTAMGRMKTNKIEGKLKTWESSGAASEFPEARKAGVMLAGMGKAVEWAKHKKRTKDAAAYDQIVSGMEAAARKLAEAAGKKDADGVKEAAGEVSRNCSSCHSQFK
jgi:cytochrome c556